MSLTIFLWSQALLYCLAAVFGESDKIARAVKMAFAIWAVVLIILGEHY